MLRSWWRLFSRCESLEREIDSEIRAHLEHKRDALIRNGLSASEAEREARLAFGNRRVWHEEVREVWSLVWLEGLVRDIRFGLRTLGKDRIFAFFAVATLALGFGTTTAVFSLINGLLLRSLPVQDSERLTEVYMTNLPPDLVQWVDGRKVAVPEMRGAPYSVMQALAADPVVAGVLGIAGHGRSAVEVNGSDILATTVTVSGGFFGTLGLSPLAGRFFTAADDVRGGPPEGWPVVLSYSGWIRLFQKSSAAVGSVIKVERQPVVVVGIAPEKFSGVNRGIEPEIYLPFYAMESFFGGFRWEGPKRVPQILVRLAPGINFESARNEITARSLMLLSAGGPPDARSREEYLAQKIELRRLSASSSGPGRTYGQALWLLLAAVIAVLLIAATNLTNLLLARASQRGPEFAVRMALGAPASRIRRQILIEVSLIALGGAAFGVALAWRLPPMLVQLFSNANNTIHIDTAPDWTITLFAAATLVATTFLAGWAPAMVSGRAQPNRILSTSSRVSKKLQGRAVLIAVQTALTLVLLLGTFLLAGSLRELWRESTGMDAANTAFYFPDLYNAGIDREDMGRAYENILRGTRQLPGVVSAAWTMTIPLTRSMSALQVTAAGRPSTPETSNLTFRHQVSDGYFQSVGLPLLAGRDFPAASATGRRNVCVLSESAAIRLFGSADAAIGRQVVPGKLPPTEVIGVSGDAKYMHLREPAPPSIYTPYWNENISPGMTLVVRSAGEDGTSSMIGAAIYRLFRDEAGRMPYVRFETMDTLRAALTLQERALTWLLGGLAAFALLISTTGTTGLLAYTIQQRRKEIGVRLALGAPQGSIQRALILRAMSWVAAGLLLGTAAAWPVRTVLNSFLYRSSVSDAGVWIATLFLLVFTTGLSAYVPAVRASRTNLTDALKID